MQSMYASVVHKQRKDADPYGASRFDGKSLWVPHQRSPASVQWEENSTVRFRLSEGLSLIHIMQLSLSELYQTLSRMLSDYFKGHTVRGVA
ncbi:jg20465 [Pararge aegeria aegeria]|uniref:Jg20465 protein n=1 Tax=Pararge aegeria aegeria TaxID=348720 RepID=A0A8S4QJA6_9NEOP|nr:jg20465 [Pararge aegeria aegeria]